MTTELKEQENKSLSALDLFAEDAGVGTESIVDEAPLVPRIRLVAKGADYTVKSDPTYIDGAEPGMFLNTLDHTLYSGIEGLTVIPVSVRKTLAEFTAKTGGEFVQNHDDNLQLWDETPYDEERSGVFLENGHNLVLSFEFLVFILNDGLISPALMSLNGTQLKKARFWMNQMRQKKVRLESGKIINPAIYYNVYTIKSCVDSNKKGHTWQGYKITRKCDTIELDDGLEIYKNCSDFAKSYLKGEVKVQAEEVVSETSENDPF